MPTASIIPLYQDAPDKAELLHERLSAVHEGAIANSSNAGVTALRHTAKIGDWEVSLGSSVSGELETASMTRFGQELHSFVLAGDKTWAAENTSSQFEDSHFFNLVTAATRENVVWTEIAVAS